MARYRAPRGYPTTLAVIRSLFVLGELVILFMDVWVIAKWPRLFKDVWGSFFSMLWALGFDAAEVVGLLDGTRRCKRLSSNAMVCADLCTTIICAALPWIAYIAGNGGLAERLQTPETEADAKASQAAEPASFLVLILPNAIAGAHFFILVLACSICCVPVAKKNRFYTIPPPVEPDAIDVEMSDKKDPEPKSTTQKD